MTSAKLPQDYASKVYAGVLGKIIGVYLGRPFEGWWYNRLIEIFGPQGVTYYVNNLPHYIAKRHKPEPHPLIVTDDDITGTFGFFRALEDHNYSPNLSAEEIGRCWLNYIIENKTILWWGGMGMSTEHTAFLRLKHGTPAPKSGSIELNGTVVAEQIGAQIFIDAWGLCSPGNPAQAARFAKAAGSVSHDGEAVYGAIVIAVMEAEAFVNPDLNHLLDTALQYIPQNCIIAQLIADLRRWHKEDAPESDGWKKTYQRVHDHYGYAKFGGNCHMIPNHALIILALLYAPDSFSEALRIVNTCGWDTDCNSANVGCIQGVRLGLDALNRDHDWRGPVADRLFLPTAEGGRGISDAVIEAHRIIKAASALHGLDYAPPKHGARYHFSFPGSVQGFQPILNTFGQPTATVSNIVSPASAQSSRCLNLRLDHLNTHQPAGVLVNTFFTPEDAKMEGYGLIGCPILYSGQTVSADLNVCHQSAGPIQARIAFACHGPEDKTVEVAGPWTTYNPGTRETLKFTVPDTQGHPIYQLRLEFLGSAPCATVRLDSVRIDGAPNTPLFSTTPITTNPGNMWRNAWVNATDGFWKAGDSDLPKRLNAWVIVNNAWGNISIGNETWTNYRFEATIRPHLASAIGIAAGYRGLSRFVRVALHHDGTVRLEQADLSGTRELARTAAKFELYREYRFALEFTGSSVRAFLDGSEIIPSTPLPSPIPGGGVAIFVNTGRALLADPVIRPLG